MLETVSLLLPFLTRPEEMVGKRFELEVDHVEVVFGWEKRYCRNDPETSMLLQCLHVLEARLSCRIHVTHT